MTIRTSYLVPLLALLLAGAAGAAKEERAILEGTVMDTAGEALAGMVVRVKGEDGSAVAEAATDELGEFSLDLVAGEFVLEIEGAGYTPFAAVVALEAGRRQAVDVNLLDAETGRRNEAIAAYNDGAKALAAGDKPTARARLAAAVEADPTLVEPYALLADLHLEAGEHAEAAAAAERYLELRPGDRNVEIIAYEAYRALGDKERSGELRAVLAADPKLAPKLAVQAYNEGATALQKGDEAAAATRFEEALALDPGLAAAHGALATVLYNRQRYTEARAAVGRLLEIDPGSVQGRRMGFLIEDAGGDLEAAAAAMEAYIEVDAEGAAELLFQRAELDFKAGELELARAGLERLLELEPDSPRAHYTLGLVYASLDPALARKHLVRFLELAPEDPEAATARELLSAL